MEKIIKFGDDAVNSVVRGIDKVVDIVKTTVGPNGRNVLIREQLNRPIITNDGVTIAKSVQLKDTAEDAGAQLVIQAANKTNDIAGDGTTTTSILAQEMIHNFNDFIEANKGDTYNVVQIQKEMLKAADDISEYLKSIATSVTDNTSIERVASISSGNAETGKLIAQAFEQAGEYGSVIVEDSKTGVDNLVSIQGMKLSNGMVTQYLLKDRIAGKTDMLDVSVLVIKDKIDSVSEMFKVLDVCINSGKKLLVICDDIEFEPLNMILMNKAKGIPLDIAIIRLPAFGELREQLLEDICIATGSTIMGRDVGRTLKDFSLEYLGEAEQVVVSMDDTVIKFKDRTSGDVNLLEDRNRRVLELQELRAKVDKAQQEQYNRRIANLLSGISVLEVGGNSEVEIKDKKLRIEDALNSVQAAIEEGIVAGGGYSFLLANVNADRDEEVSIGEKIVYDSLVAVTRQIAENAGYDGDEVLSNCCNLKLGFNALTGEYEDLIETGVINAVKVDRYSLLNATSVAATVITMGGLVVDAPEPDSNVFQLQTAGLPPM